MQITDICPTLLAGDTITPQIKCYLRKTLGAIAVKVEFLPQHFEQILLSLEYVYELNIN